MRMAEAVAIRSTCERRKVGCVITDWGGSTVVGIGYNGSPRGWDNRCERPDEPGNCGCLHAELNALLKAPYLTDRLVLYCTLSPCLQCAKMVINSAVRAVYFRSAFRDLSGLDVLSAAGIKVQHLPEVFGESVE
jgi:dCMP deaminase